MSIEDNENYYILEEEKEKVEIDETPRNFASYSIDDDEEGESNETEEEKVSAIGLMFKLMFNPVEGWKYLRRSKIKPEALQGGCFYPLLALLAIGKFAEFFYSVNVELGQVVTQAVISFVAVFFGYFAVQMVLCWLLPKDMVKKFDTVFGKQYLIMSLSTLAFFSIFTDLLPMLWPILIFLPIWTFYIMFKGIRFFKFAQNQEMKFFVYSCAAVIGIPLLIDWVLNSVLPY